MLKLRKALTRRIPVGVAVAPFEFAWMLGYGVASGKILWDLVFSGSDPAIVALPFGFRETVTWLILLLLGSVLCSVGLVLTGRRRLLGVHMERAGLYMAAAAILTYLAGIINRIGFSANLTLVTTSFMLLAALYRVVLLTQIIDSGVLRAPLPTNDDRTPQ